MAEADGSSFAVSLESVMRIERLSRNVKFVFRGAYGNQKRTVLGDVGQRERASERQNRRPRRAVSCQRKGVHIGLVEGWSNRRRDRDQAKRQASVPLPLVLEDCPRQVQGVGGDR